MSDYQDTSHAVRCESYVYPNGVGELSGHVITPDGVVLVTSSPADECGAANTLLMMAWGGRRWTREWRQAFTRHDLARLAQKFAAEVTEEK